MKILDGFCGAGGATRGYQLGIRGAHVTGVDIDPQPDYCGDAFVQGDAMAFIRTHGHEYDLIHVSPPCQWGIPLTCGTNAGNGKTYLNLIAPARDACLYASRPYILEQPPGRASKQIRIDLKMCGESSRIVGGRTLRMFPDLSVIRHRNFELHNVSVPQPLHGRHRGRVSGMRHSEWFEGPYFAVYGEGGGKGSVAQWREAMGIDWTWERKSIAEAIPPAFTQYIGWHL